MRGIVYFLVSICVCSCDSGEVSDVGNSQQSDSTVKNTVTRDSLQKDNDGIREIDFGYYDKYEKLPKLKFIQISEDEFSMLEQRDFMDTRSPKQNKDFFFIRTAVKSYKFKKYKDYGGNESWNGYEYLGYYPETKLFAISENSTSEGIGFGQLTLLDSLSDYKFNIVSIGDDRVELPIPSINNNYFVYYYNSVYEHKNSEIGILKIHDRSNMSAYLSEYASYQSDDFAIEKIVWKSDKSFYVKGYEEVYENEDWVKKYSYYKTEFE